MHAGFAQSVALARVFLRKSAQIVILDEALGQVSCFTQSSCLLTTFALCAAQMDAIKKRDFIMPRLFDFIRRHNMTLILVAHDVQSVCPLVDRVFVMESGRLAQQGSHDELTARRAQPYVRLCGL